jgi:hypothetical protein
MKAKIIEWGYPTLSPDEIVVTVESCGRIYKGCICEVSLSDLDSEVSP